MHKNAQECVWEKNNTTSGKKQHHTQEAAAAAVWPQRQCGSGSRCVASAARYSAGVAVSVWQCDSSGGAAEVWHRQRTSGRRAEAGTPHLRYGAAGETGGLPEGPPPPPGPQGRRRCHPSPHCATARRGRPVAYPKGRPNPAGPQGRRRRHPSSSCATARRGRPEAYTRRAAPTVKNVTLHPLR